MNTKGRIALAIIAIIIIAGVAVAYNYYSNQNADNPDNPSATPTSTPVPASLTGSGATFPVPFIDKVITEYIKAKPYIQVNYQGTGSGAGITALTGKTVDFAGSDAPLSASERSGAPNTRHIPETIGAVAIAYNIPAINSGQLRLTGQVIADIFEGKITKMERPRNYKPKSNPYLTLKYNSYCSP